MFSQFINLISINIISHPHLMGHTQLMFFYLHGFYFLVVIIVCIRSKSKIKLFSSIHMAQQAVSHGSHGTRISVQGPQWLPKRRCFSTLYWVGKIQQKPPANDLPLD